MFFGSAQPGNDSREILVTPTRMQLRHLLGRLRDPAYPGLLPDTQGEHDGVTHYEYLDTGIPGTLECGDARGVAGMLTPTALLTVASLAALSGSAVLSLTRRRSS